LNDIRGADHSKSPAMSLIFDSFDDRKHA
jgi:hypothetical protein